METKIRKKKVKINLKAQRIITKIKYKTSKMAIQVKNKRRRKRKITMPNKKIRKKIKKKMKIAKTGEFMCYELFIC